MEHLNSDAAFWLDAPDEVRIDAIRLDKWVPHSHAQQVLFRLTEMHQNVITGRVQSLILVGDTNSGKTHIMQHYADQHRPRLVRHRRKRDQPAERWPVLLLQTPPSPDEVQLYHALLDAVGTIYPAKAHISHKRKLVEKVLQGLGVRLIMLDEFQHGLMGSVKSRNGFLTGIKFLANDLKIPFACAGIRTAHSLIRYEEQLSSRFDAFKLRPLAINPEYYSILASFEQMLPLRLPSGLIEPQLAAALLAMSGNTIGELSRLLRIAAVHAVRTKQERISLAQLPYVGYVSPAHRQDLEEDESTPVA